MKGFHWAGATVSAIVAVALAGAQAPAPGLTATIGSGQIRGTALTRSGAVFKGIPYAAPPIGDFRWREPQPVKAWSSVRDATTFGPSCAQPPTIIDPKAAELSKEDCLYLNVWTPEWPAMAHKAVMVWIPGGGNFAGSANADVFDGESLIRHDIVLVTLNYRLASFGFFAHPALTRESPHHASGNYGLLDLFAALKWVHDNIAAFGGDPANVTIFGESAGSLNVSVLMTSPLAAGLFRRVIGQSGAVILVGDPLTLHEAEARGETFAQRWNVPSGASAADLRAVSAADILKTEPDYFRIPPPNLGVTVDGYVFASQPAATFASGRQHKVGMILGNTAHERVPGSPLPVDLAKAIEDVYGPLAARAKPLYAVDDPFYRSPALQWATDTSFRCSAVTQLGWHAAAGNPAFEYEFARVPPGREKVGATHASELAHVFGTLQRVGPFGVGPPVKSTVTDAELSEAMQKYWTNFAKTGDPNGGSLPTWPPFDPGARRYMHFTDDGPVSKAALRQAQCDVFIDNVRRRMMP
jgi:para-nitrobenzyl esterase